MLMYDFNETETLEALTKLLRRCGELDGFGPAWRIPRSHGGGCA
jgi:hypothetical protein